MTNNQKSPFLQNDGAVLRSISRKKSDTIIEDIPNVAVPTPRSKKKRLAERHIPVTVFTGYLGAGKTTVITNLIKQMPSDYKVAWLKNEMGNTAVDTVLASDQHTATVKEMLQGCICHVMIGQLSDALDELIDTNPDRILIEASGSATPAPVVWEIRNNERLFVDGVVTVVDALHFAGYIDKSPALKMQAKYTDLILINKHESLDDFTLEQNLDDLYDINLDTPKVKTHEGFISTDIVFGLDSSLFMRKSEVEDEEKDVDKKHYHREVDLIEIRPKASYALEEALSFVESLSGKDFYRIKGVLRDAQSDYIVNCAFGQAAMTRLSQGKHEQRIVFMGENIKESTQQIMDFFILSREDFVFTPRNQ